ncbi:MAG: zeta toxin family protein [Bacillota bacterium]
MLSKTKPKLVIIAGPNGSGKTSVTRKILEHEWIEGCTQVNPDDIARDVFGDWNSDEAVLKAAKYSTQIRERCLASQSSLFFETVLSTYEKLDFIRRAQTLGYFIRLFFVGTDSPEINASRVARRVIEGGHTVPIQKIISRYSKSIANCSAAVSMVDRLYIYDNSIENSDPTLLFRASSGTLTKRYGSINTWAQTIFESLSST